MCFSKNQKVTWDALNEADKMALNIYGTKKTSLQVGWSPGIVLWNDNGKLTPSPYQSLYSPNTEHTW